jgi:hypothetical protein
VLEAHRPIVLALYLVWLFRGNALRGGGLTMRTDTAKGYLRAAAVWAKDRNLPDPRYLTTRTTFMGRQMFAPPLDKLLDHRRRWESLPNRREPLTPTMVSAAQANATNCHPDSRSAALFDWFVLGLSTGFRLSEWAQRSHTTIDRIAGLNSLPIAIIRCDVTFFNSQHQILSEADLITSVLIPTFARLRWRVQKNGNNGETHTYATSGTEHCPVSALVRIINRAIRLRLGVNLPLAMYRSHPTSPIHFVSETDIAASLQLLAQQCYGPLDQASLQRFTSHSVRVGACVLLHAAGKTGAFIKQRLRWKSDTFLLYLRDVPAMAVSHANALSQAHTLLIAPTTHHNV